MAAPAFEAAMLALVRSEVVGAGDVSTWGAAVEALGYDRRQWARAASRLRHRMQELGYPWWRFVNADREIPQWWHRADTAGSPTVRDLLTGEGVAIGADDRITQELIDAAEIRRRLGGASW